MAYPNLPLHYRQHADRYSAGHLRIVHKSQGEVQIFFRNNKTLLKQHKLTLSKQVKQINERFGLTLRYQYVRNLKCGITANVSLITLLYFTQFWGVELFEMLTPNCFERIEEKKAVSDGNEKGLDVW